MARADDDDERRSLLETLEYQRASVHSIVEGLDEAAWHRSVVPSRWTPAGMVEHLGNVERHWFAGVLDGSDGPLAWDEGRPAYDPTAAFVCERPSGEVLAYYRARCAAADEILARTNLSDAPRGVHDDPGARIEVPSARFIVLHVIEETAAHTGHLEIARELLDGGRGLGLR